MGKSFENKYLVSSCLMGAPCKYNGGHNYAAHVVDFLKGKAYILVCPEVLGGLSTPRPPSEICFGQGETVLEGNAKVLTDEGGDVTRHFILGAEKVLEIALKEGCTSAILKEYSPSCGSSGIYNGHFSNEKIKGKGVTTTLLNKYNISVISEVTLKEKG